MSGSFAPQCSYRLVDRNGQTLGVVPFAWAPDYATQRVPAAIQAAVEVHLDPEAARPTDGDYWPKASPMEPWAFILVGLALTAWGAWEAHILLTTGGISILGLIACCIGPALLMLPLVRKGLDKAHAHRQRLIDR